MKSQLIAALALTIGLGSQAFAQTTASTGEKMPDSWLGGIGDVFFPDSSAPKMRSQHDVKTRWSKLSPERQKQARADCDKMYPSKGETAVKPKTGAAAEARTGGMVTACNWVMSQK